MDLGVFTFIWEAVVSLALLVGGWAWKSIQQRLDDIDQRHTRTMDKHMDYVAKHIDAQAVAQARLSDVVVQTQLNYVQKSELREMRLEILDRFDRIENLVGRNKG